MSGDKTPSVDDVDLEKFGVVVKLSGLEDCQNTRTKYLKEIREQRKQFVRFRKMRRQMIAIIDQRRRELLSAPQ